MMYKKTPCPTTHVLVEPCKSIVGVITSLAHFVVCRATDDDVVWYSDDSSLSLTQLQHGN